MENDEIIMLAEKIRMHCIVLKNDIDLLNSIIDEKREGKSISHYEHTVLKVKDGQAILFCKKCEAEMVIPASYVRMEAMLFFIQGFMVWHSEC